jgi:outer membrane murein-binding lipoprotein Lpp
MKTKIRNSISGLLLIQLLLACFALLPSVQAAPDPAPPPGANTRDGQGAMANVTTGNNNSAFGTNALNTLTTGNNNAAQGNSALFSNLSGSGNVAIGSVALRFSTGDQNTAVGNTAMNANLGGDSNTALGYGALRNSLSGNFNIAIGHLAGFGVTSASGNVCIGVTGANENERTFVANLTNDQAQPFNNTTIKLVTVRVADGRLGVTTLAAGVVSSQKVEEQQASIAELQKKIEVLTAQLKEQASQIQKVSAQLEVNKITPQIVLNNQ